MDSLKDIQSSLDTKRIYVGNEIFRFVLGEPAQDNNILVIGVNPSKADDKQDDPTIRNVRKFVKSTHFIDGWIMVNPYPLRNSDPRELPSECDNALVEYNIKIINEIIQKFNVKYVWAGWGSGIEEKEYLWKCLYRLIQSIPSSLKWFSRPGLSMNGNVIHPYYPRGEVKLVDFDIISHLKNKGIYSE